MDHVRARVLAGLLFVFGMIASGSTLASTDTNVDAPGKRMFGAHRGMGPEAPWIGLSLRHRDELKLSAEQVSALEQLRMEFGEKVKPIHTELLSIERQIRNLLQEGSVDLAQAKAKIGQAEKLRAELRFLRVETLDKGKAVLTPEQMDQLKELLSSMQRRFRKPQGQSS